MALGRRGVPCIGRNRQRQSGAASSGWPRTCGTSLLSDRMFVLGAIHILSGFTVLSLGIMAFLHRTYAHEYCVAIITGCLLVGTGMLGILTAHMRTTCTLISFFLCAIFCVALAGLVFALCIIGIANDFGRAGAGVSGSPLAASASSSQSTNRQSLVQSISSNQLAGRDYSGSLSIAQIANGAVAPASLGSSDNADATHGANSGARPPVESQRNDFPTPRSSSSDDTWRKNALSIHCTQLAASVLALAVALVASVTCAKRVCCNPNVSFFENRVRVALVLPQLLPAPPFTEEATREQFSAHTDMETQTETQAQTEGEAHIQRERTEARIEIANRVANRIPPVQQSSPVSIDSATDSALGDSIGLRRPEITQSSQPSQRLLQTETRVPLTLSSASRHVRAYYRCGMPIGPFFLNASDLPTICPPERTVGEPPASSRSRSHRRRTSGAESGPEPHTRRSMLPALRHRTRSRRRDSSLPDNRIVYLYTTSRSNELEGYVYPAPPPPYCAERQNARRSGSVEADTSRTPIVHGPCSTQTAEASTAPDSANARTDDCDRPLLRTEEHPPGYSTLDRASGSANASRLRVLRSARSNVEEEERIAGESSALLA